MITIPLDIGIIDDDEGIKIIRVQENLLGRIRRKMRQTGANNDEAVIGKPKAVMGYSVMRRWIRKLITYAYNFILKQFQWPDYAWTWVRNARKATIAHLDNNVMTDVVISVSHPFSCHFVGSYAKLKYPNIKWIMDCGDPFCFEEASPCNNFALYKKLNHHIEMGFFKRSDWISVTTPETKEEYNKLFKLDKKIQVISPMLNMRAQRLIEDFKEAITLPNKSSIKLVFAGTLYAKVRNPIELINLLKKINVTFKLKIEMHFVGGVIDLDEIKLPDKKLKLIFHGKVSQDTALRHMLNSDILVNIGNTTRYQLPSKLVEYVSTGKPILNVTCRQDDSSENFLLAYPAAKTVCLNGNLSKTIIKQTSEFIKTTTPINNHLKKYWSTRYATHKIASQYENLLNVYCE
ncbi:hypothetical protein OAL72_00620 [bacterium]|nr:hypothetical protein [bacterium]